MTELMVHVERAVRPVRAGGSRKMKMREELLAHLTAIYAEERARAGTDADAVREAMKRFGDPATLTKELQDTVPRVERLLATPMPWSAWEWRAVRWFHRHPGENAIRHAARVAAVFAGYVFAVLAATSVAVDSCGDFGSPLRLNLGSLAVMTAHAFVTTMLCIGFFGAACGPLNGQTLLVAVGCGLPLVAGGPALAAGLAAVQPHHFQGLSMLPQADGFWLRLVLTSLFWLVVLAVGFRLVTARQRRVRVWMELKLDG